MANKVLHLIAVIFVVVSLLKGTTSTIFTLRNNCPYTIWPATSTYPGCQPFPKSGFELARSTTTSLQLNSSWSGTMWARTDCSTGPTGNFSCLTGDCGTGKMEICDGYSPQAGSSPATHIDFNTLDVEYKNNNDRYVISLAYGYNLPVSVAPLNVNNTCKETECTANINEQCPLGLSTNGKDGKTRIGCKSDCLQFATKDKCCTLKEDPNGCKSSTVTELFRKACPEAYTLPYDEDDSMVRCRFTDYTITFCPSLESA